ncbi:MAG: extracellular solute-binding protein [Acetanaerobacterium sp.]
MKKFYLKKAIAAVLAVALVPMIATGCQPASPADSDPGSPDASSGDTNTQPVTLTYAIIENPGWTISNDTPVMQKMAEETGVNIDYVILPASDPQSKFNTLLMGGELPDMMSNVAATLTNYGGQGAFIDLAPYLDTKLSNVKKLIEESDYAQATLYTDFGKMFAIPRFHQNENSYTWMIRKDWLDTLGMEAPKTTDDWFTVLTAFKEQDPGNVGDKLIPMVVRGGISNLLSVAEPAFGMHWQIYSDVDNDGNYDMNAVLDNYKAELQWFNTLYSNKLLDNEVVTCDTSRWEEYMTNGYAGATIDYGVRTDVFTNALHDAGFTDASLVAVSPPTGPDGKAGLPSYTDALLDRSVAISKDCDDVDAACKWLNYLFSDDGAWLTGVGIDGVTYNGVDENGYPNWIDEIANNPNDMTVTAPYGIQQPDAPRNMTDYEYSLIWGTNTLEAIKLDKDYWLAPYLPGGYTDAMTAEDITLSSDVNSTIKEDSAKFITGAQSLDTFDAFVAEIKDAGATRLAELFSTAQATMKAKIAKN